MGTTIYSLEGGISSFFASHQPITQQECNGIAESLVGSPVNPVSIQGQFSYTVVAGPHQNKIVQFRDASSTLNTELWDLARKIHGSLVPVWTFHGQIGKLSPLFIYVMNKLVGTPYILACHRLRAPSTAPLHNNTIEDFALYASRSNKIRPS